MTREHIVVGTPPYSWKMDQHVDWRTANGLWVPIPRAWRLACRTHGFRAWENRGCPSPPTEWTQRPGRIVIDGRLETVNRWVEQNYAGFLSVEAVGAATHCRIVCSSEKPDDHFDIVLNGQEIDVKARGPFLTPKTFVSQSDHQTLIPEFRPHIPLLLVNFVQDRQHELTGAWICGVIDYATFWAKAFVLQLDRQGNRPLCLAITANHLQPIRRVAA